MIEHTIGLPVQPPDGVQRTWRLADILLITISSVIILFAGVFALQQLKLDALALTLASAAWEAVTLIGCVVLLGLRRKGLPWQAVGLRLVPRRWVWIAVGAGLACLFLTGLVALLTDIILGRSLTNPQLPFLVPKGLTFTGELLMFVLAGLVVPFAEELYFRGVLFVWLRQRFGFWVGAIVSAVVFGAAHGDVAIAAGIAVMGFIQAWTYERSHSLWTTYIIHALNNSVKLVLLYGLLASGLNLR